MSSTLTQIGIGVTALFSPGDTSQIYVVGLALFLAMLVVLMTAITVFFGFAIVAQSQKRSGPTTIRIGDRDITFDEYALLPLLSSLWLAIVTAFQQFFATVSSAARSIVTFIAQNPRRIITLIVLSGFIAVYLMSPQLIFPTLGQAYNCFVGPLVRSIVMPFPAIGAFLTSTALPALNYVSRVSKTATTSALLHAAVGAITSLFTTMMYLGAAVLQFGQAQVAWVGQTTPPNEVGRILVIGPDFNQTSHLIGDAIYNLRFVTEQACSPLQPYVFEPVLRAFDEEDFALALNSTLAFTYVATTQNVLKAVGEYLVALSNDPGGSFGDLVPLLSFNSTIDTANSAVRHWVRFGDAFFPNLVDALNTLLRDATGLPLPTLPFPRRGLFTLFPGAPIDFALTTAKLTQNLVFNLLFNPDVAFSFPDGMNIWKIHELLDKVTEYTSILTDYTDFVSDYLRELGQNFEDELTAPLSLDGAERSMHVAAGDRAFVVLATQGEVVNLALQFVANIVDRVPCVIVAVAEAIVELLKLGNDLLVGTIYTFLNAAFSGRVESPFTYAQSLFEQPPYLDTRCRITFGLNVIHVFTIPVLASCPDYFDAVARCRSPVLNSSPPPINTFSPPLYPSWIPADQGTLSFTRTGCPGCVGVLVDSNNLFLTPPGLFVNRYNVVAQKVLKPFSCLYALLASLCVGTDCPLQVATADQIILDIAGLITLGVNTIIHFDRLGTSTYYFRDICYPLATAPFRLQSIEISITNEFRHIIDVLLDAIPGNTLSCPLANNNNVAVSTFVPCCVLNIVDAAFGFVTDLAIQFIHQVQDLLQAFLPAIVGGTGVTSYSPAPFTFDEPWIQVAADGIACLPTQFIPPNLICTIGIGNVKATAAATLGDIVFELLVVVPRFIVGGANGLLNLLLSPTAAEFNTLLVSLINPLVQSFGNILMALGMMLRCVDLTNVLSTTFIAIATFITGALNAVIPVIIDLAVAGFQFLVGVFALFTGDASIFFMAVANFAEAIFANINTIVKAFAGILISLLSQSFICSVTDAVCFANEIAPTPAIQNSPFVQACNEGLGTTDMNDFGFAFCDNRKRHAFDSPQACFAYLADFGYPRAQQLAEGGGNNTPSDEAERRAVDCYARVNSAGALVEYLMSQQKLQNLFTSIVSNAPGWIEAHWRHEAQRATQRIDDLYARQQEFVRSYTHEPTTTDRTLEAGIDFARFIRAFNAKLEGDERLANEFRASLLGHHEAQRRVKRSVARFPQHDSAFVNLAVVLRHVRDFRWPKLSWLTAPAPVNTTTAPALTKRSTSTPTDRTAAALRLGGRLVRSALRAGIERMSRKIAHLVHGSLDRAASIDALPESDETPAVAAARRIDAGELTYRFSYVDSRGYASLSEWAASGDAVAPLAITISPDVLPVLGLPFCNDSEQIVCTQCAYVDDIVRVSERSFRAARTFYTAPGNATGTYNELVDRFNTNLNNLLVDPAGTDTYLTEPRTIPFITTRIWDIRWPWQWDFDEFLTILNEAQVPCDETDPLDAIDIDENFKDAFRALFGNLLPIAQQAICRVTIAPAETVTRLTERYIMCDYDEALYGIGNKGSDAADGPQRLLNGFAAAVLLLALFGLVVEIVPGGSGMFIMLAPIVLWYGTFWFGYGSAPTCTLPAIGQPFGAYPVAAPMDAYGLLESVFAPSTPYPVALIDPAARDAFADVLITTCGPPPPVIDCATAAGFDGIYDNIFFSTGVLFGDEFNAAVAASLGAVSPAIEQAALEFTEAHIAELEANHNSGDVCNRLTFVASVFGLLGILATIIGGLLQISFLIPFIVLIVVLVYIIMLFLNEAISQGDRHYVHGTSRQDAK